MHKTLTETFELGKSRLTCRHFGEFRVHAGIPAAETLYSVTGVEIFDVVALTGRTNESTGSAAEAGFGKLCPFGSIEEFFCFSDAESVFFKRCKRKFFKSFSYRLFLFVDGFIVCVFGYFFERREQFFLPFSVFASI